ncbi:MAG: hypothetical protein FWG02_09765 [Holophagaceae bacterium]|nr:hypothetical protein [Holophagaceae bacterium]
MIISDLDDLVLEQDDGEATVEELGRSVLSEGPWTVVAYLVKRRIGDNPWQGPFLWLHRYQKVSQGWKLASRFRTTEPCQVEKLSDALQKWSHTKLHPNGINLV